MKSVRSIVISIGTLSLSLLLSGLISHVALADSAQNGFVGNDACASCHEPQVQDWTNSHHDLAMQDVNENTVLGDFDNATFVYEGVTTTFFRKGDEYWVKTDNESGELQDYRVAYVFGVYPLQQLLLPIHNDRLNALSIAWDARNASEGCLLYTSPSPRDAHESRMPSSA